MSAPKFPLAGDVFESARLSFTQLHAYKEQIQQLISHALDECDRADEMGRAAYNEPWVIVGVQDKVTALWRQEQPTNTPRHSACTHKSEYRLIGNVSGNYRDLMALHYAETSNDLYEWLQFVHQSTLDAHIIQTVESASAERPHQYFGVKWAAFQMSKLATKADQCFVEYMTYRKDRQGREVGVRVTLPIGLPEIDIMADSLKMRRMDTQTVQILRPLNEKTTRTFVMIKNDFLPAAPATYIKTLLAQNVNAAMGMDARRIRHHGLVAEKDWMPNASRRGCVVCLRTFGATRGRHHCRLCGDVICRKCTVMRDTAEPVTRKTFKVTKTKFCVLCIANLRGRDEGDHAIADLWADHRRETDYIPNNSMDDGSKSSVWSETDSECYSGMVLFLPEDTVDCIETIDTKDMIRGASLGGEGESPLSTSGVFESSSFGDFKKRRSRTDSTNLLRTSARSLDQNLAEQEALLRQMVMATTQVRGVRPPPARTLHKSNSNDF
jgi:hypothetical protein